MSDIIQDKDDAPDIEDADGPCDNSEDGLHSAAPGDVCTCGLRVPEENPRERGDDDGVEYGDPRDAMEERLLGD